VPSSLVGIETTKEYLKFSIQGESGSGSTVFRAREGMDTEAVVLDVDEPVSLSFSSKYLNIFNKAASLASKVTLSLNADTPLLVEYELPNTMGVLKFYLAPKINE
jgi:proliferating cell nuclear antigen